MKDGDKTKEELLVELQKLRQNAISQQELHDKNITERKRAEKELRSIEAFNRNLLDTIPFGMDIVDEHGTVLFQNENFKKTFRNEALGNKCWDLYRDDKTQCGDCPLKAGITVGKIAISESTGVLGNKIFEIFHTGILFEGKKALLEIFIDITERKLAENKIHEKDIQFRKLSSNLSDLIYQFTRKPDGTYCVPIASEGIKNIFGCSPEDVLDDFTPIGRVLFPEDSARVISDIEHSAQNLTYFTCEFRVQIPGKDIQWIYSKSTPEKLEDGSITWYGFNADITKLKQADSELIKAKEKAEESDRLKSAFLANMSHEIRTPMNGILGFAGLLKDPHLTGKEQQEYIRIIEKSGARLLNLINDIVDISKIEAGLIELHLTNSNINEQIDFIYSFFKPEVEAKGVHLSINNALPSKEAIIQTDQEKMMIILTNLVKNAIKFTKEGSIAFGYEKKENNLEFFVKDTGIGIPKNLHESIFERFIQAENTYQKTFQGVGLGLAISKTFVEMLGGKIWVESEEGVGSTFYFTIPYHVEAEENSLTKKAVSVEGTENFSKNLKILIAEDDETSEMLISIVVKTFGDDILIARNGVEAVEICRSNPDLDLILMDILMPEMGGYEATKQIREFNKEVVIIAQTAYALSGDREMALEAGCNDYLAKPISKNGLQMLVQKFFNNY